MQELLIVVIFGLVALTAVALTFASRRNVHIWLGAYLHQAKKERTVVGPIHLYFCIADHYEPFWQKADRSTALKRVKGWVPGYAEAASKHKDADGNHPKHTYFYPIEEYDPEILDVLAGHCRGGYGDVEVHLHHDNDKDVNFKKSILSFTETLHKKHGFLRKDVSGRIIYGFIHGNWALDNSRKDGRWCGVNNELSILKETGCYADFTLPSAPDETQTRMINSIYFAKDDTERPKSHDVGEEAEVGRWNDRDLLLIQGPLALNWKKRKFGFLPKIENGELSAKNPATSERIDLWVKTAVHIKGAPEHVFVKIYTHGAQEANAASLLHGNLDLIWTYLETNYNDHRRYVLHYVTGFEMYRQVLKIASMERA